MDLPLKPDTFQYLIKPLICSVGIRELPLPQFLIAPLLENFTCFLMIIREAPDGFEYQESRGGHDLDEITRAFGERVNKVVQ
jgi:hypothetical protein